MNWTSVNNIINLVNKVFEHARTNFTKTTSFNMSIYLWCTDREFFRFFFQTKDWNMKNTSSIRFHDLKAILSEVFKSKCSGNPFPMGHPTSLGYMWTQTNKTFAFLCNIRNFWIWRHLNQILLWKNIYNISHVSHTSWDTPWCILPFWGRLIPLNNQRHWLPREACNSCCAQKKAVSSTS